MRRILAGLMFVGLAVALFGGCGSNDDDATGSAECCKARKLCMSCFCNEQQISAGQQDHKHACELVLEQWDPGGCVTCDEHNCLSGC